MASGIQQIRAERFEAPPGCEAYVKTEVHGLVLFIFKGFEHFGVESKSRFPLSFFKNIHLHSGIYSIAQIIFDIAYSRTSFITAHGTSRLNLPDIHLTST